MTMSEKVIIKIHFPTIDIEILYINKKDVRNIVSLEFIKYIKDRIDLSISF